MKLSALLLTFAIALGLTAPLDAKTKYKAPKPAKHATTHKAPKVKTKPAKVKKMKFRKAKTSNKVPRVTHPPTPKPQAHKSV